MSQLDLAFARIEQSLLDPPALTRWEERWQRLTAEREALLQRAREIEWEIEELEDER